MGPLQTPRRCPYSVPPPLQAVRRFWCFVVRVVSPTTNTNCRDEFLYLFARKFIPYFLRIIIQRWRFLCVPTLKIKVLRWVFLTRRNHQRCSWTATFFKRHRSEVNTLKCCQELKYGGNIRAAYIQKWKLPPARLGVDQQLQLAPPLGLAATVQCPADIGLLLQSD